MKSLGFEQGRSLDDITFLKEYDNWMNDVQPIPIRNDRDFFEIHKKVWGVKWI